jgi:hypothetical protein
MLWRTDQPRCAVFRLRKRAERLAFSVTARDAEQAIERAIKEYDVLERERRRISVQRKA